MYLWAVGEELHGAYFCVDVAFGEYEDAEDRARWLAGRYPGREFEVRQGALNVGSMFWLLAYSIMYLSDGSGVKSEKKHPGVIYAPYIPADQAGPRAADGREDLLLQRTRTKVRTGRLLHVHMD